jgi:CubicO group peptidase (beta-lactamase class C family)
MHRFIKHSAKSRIFPAALFVAFLISIPAHSAGDFVKIKPSEAGFSPERLARLDNWLNEFVKKEELIGVSIAILRHGKLVHFFQSGVADRERDYPLKDDTYFRLFSMTKPITTVALMTLVEEGKCLLDDPVAKYLPEFKDVKVYVGTDKKGEVKLETPHRPLTIRHILSHTSGLSYGLNPEDAIDKLYDKEKVFDDKLTLSEFSLRLAKMPLVFHPGESWRYAAGVELAGRLIEVISGQDFESFVKARVLDPLGMKSTKFYLEENERNRLVQMYMRNDEGRIVIVDPPAGRTHDYRREHVAFISGGAGLLSTLSDYQRFTQMLLNGGELDGIRILSSKTVDLMMRDHTPPDAGPKPSGMEGYGFGLGGAVLRDVAKSGLPLSKGDYTWAGGGGPYFWIDREEDMCVVMMTQFYPVDFYDLRRKFRVLVYQALVEKAHNR